MGIILDLFIVVLTDHLKMTTSLMVGFLKMTTFWKPNSRYYHKIWRNCSQFYLNINSEDEFMKGWFFFLFRLQPWFWVSLILMLILRRTAHYVLPIQSKKVIAFLQAKVHLKPDYLILGYKGRGGVGGGGGWYPKIILMNRSGSSYSTGATHQIPPDPPSPMPHKKWTDSYWVTGALRGLWIMSGLEL